VKTSQAFKEKPTNLDYGAKLKLHSSRGGGSRDVKLSGTIRIAFRINSSNLKWVTL
jgi:hypothetical protein